MSETVTRGEKACKACVCTCGCGCLWGLALLVTSLLGISTLALWIGGRSYAARRRQSGPPAPQ